MDKNTTPENINQKSQTMLIPLPMTNNWPSSKYIPAPPEQPRLQSPASVLHKPQLLHSSLELNHLQGHWPVGCVCKRVCVQSDSL
jgi:hypothetical protein